MRYDNTYSRVIAWLKIILPILALAILSTLFLVARTIDPAKNIPYADVDIEELTREQRIGSPDYSGITANGTAVRLKAQQAKPDPKDQNRIIGADIDAIIDLPDGRSFDITALSMEFDNTQRIARLGGGVVITSPQKIEMRTEILEIGLNTTRVASDTKSVVKTKTGTLTSGKFVMTGDGTADKPYLMVFKGGVRLIYDPRGQ